MSRAAPWMLVLLLLPFTPGATAGGAVGPDADGAWLLTFAFARASAGPAHAALEVERVGDAAAVGARELGAWDLPAGASEREVAFLPAEGAGRYHVTLLLDGESVDTVAFDVDHPGASRVVRFEVADEPTRLELTNDEVNADGKTKSPGEALVTRAVVSDANGLAELSGVTWRVERAGVAFDSGLVALPAAANVTSHSFELRYERAPLEAGPYRLVLEARKGAEVLASAARTFHLRDVASTLLSGAVANLTPDVASWQNVSLVIGDKNGAPGPLEARVYRGSARAEPAGLTAALGPPLRESDVGGVGASSVPLALHVPARATPGAYRVSLYQNGSLVASLPFEVRPLPTLGAVVATSQGSRLVLLVNASGEGFVQARLAEGDSASSRVMVPLERGARIELEAPRRGTPLTWRVDLLAREGGPALASRNGTWSAPADGPPLDLAPLTLRGRLPAAWRVVADGRSVEGANASFQFTRWDGAGEPALGGMLDGDRIRVTAPPDIAPGRYGGTLLLTFPDGSASEARWTFEAGAWVELALGDAIVDGRVATMPLQNVGAVRVARLVVEAEPHARVSLAIGERAFPGREVGGRVVFEGVHLAPGDEASLRVELPPGPTAAGTRAVAVRVLARAEVG